MIHLVVFNTGEVSNSSEAHPDTGTDEPGNSWSVNITLNGEPIQKALTLTSPVEPAEERECLWYLEHYTNSPFHADRAEKCVQILDRYAISLYSQLRLDKILLNQGNTASNPGTADKNPQTLLLEVVETTDKPIDQPIHRLYWELLIRLPTSPLFQPSLFEPSPTSAVGKVIITRSFSSDSLAVNRLPIRNSGIALKPAIGTERQIFNVLLVVARDLDPNKPEADPTIGLEPLLAIQKELQKRESGCLLSVEVVRPGTFTAFNKHLKAATQEHGKGYYHLVHFDVHGVVKMRAEGADKGSKVPTAGLLFASKTFGRAMDFVPTKKIVTLLHEHGIELVVLNACESANPRSGDSANLAKALLDEGVYNVVAMQCKVMSGAAMLFSSRFYQKFLQERLPFSEAVSEAQMWLSEHTQRSAKYGLEVSLQDWIVPVVYVKDKDAQIIDHSSLNPKTPPTPPDLLSWPQSLSKPSQKDGIPELIGRGRDCLALERDLIESGLVFLHGVGGVGKSALLQHLTSIWKATQFTKRVLYVDFASSPTVNHCRFIERVRSQIDPGSVTRLQKFRNWISTHRDDDKYSQADITEFVNELHERSTILVLDSLDLPLSFLPSGFRSGSLSTEQRERLISLISRIVDYVPTGSQKKPLIILTSRHEKWFWQRYFPNISGRYFHLKEPDGPSAQSIAYQVLHRVGVDTAAWAVKETNTLHHILSHLNRNPLALELFLPYYKDLGSLDEALDTLFNGRFDYYWFKASTSKLSRPGGDRIFRDIDELVKSARYELRMSLRCLFFFWLEGPSSVGFLGAIHKEGLHKNSIEEEADTLGTYWKVLYDLGICDMPSPGTVAIRPLHPVFTLYLRCWGEEYNIGEDRVTDLQLLNVFRFSFDETIMSLTIQQAKGELDFEAYCQIMKRSMPNAMTCMKIYSIGPLPIEQWPRDSMIAFLDASRISFHDDVPEQRRLMASVDTLLNAYVNFYGGSQKALKPEDLAFALHLSNHLGTIYLFELDVGVSRAEEQIELSLSLIRASESKYHAMTLPQDMYRKMLTFRLKATASLLRKKFEEADKYWKLQTEIEVAVLGSGPGDTANNALFANVRNMDTPTNDPEINGMRQVVRDAFLGVLPEMAKMRQASWKVLIEYFRKHSVNDRENIPIQQIAPLIANFGQATSGLSRQFKRVVNVTEDVGFTLPIVGHAGWLVNQLDEAADQGNSKTLFKSHISLYEEALKARNFTDAEMHLKALTQQMEVLDQIPEEVRSQIKATQMIFNLYKNMDPEAQEQIRNFSSQLATEFSSPERHAEAQKMMAQLLPAFANLLQNDK
ncbi:hypothetical protein BDN72DRAFT_649370 [Pluteus cervinus]|uniref:Uncharacterized protein n=1 Tax=Pluteus cervinus TaxID=181527 RepID=A0ACD3ATF7_9AGAR|nr:hypothetical protein BDN72DRAFT_649370 [Pluteus cervinus]